MLATGKNIAIVCNPLAGVGKAITLAEKVREYLTDKNIGYSLFKEIWPNNYSNFTDVFIVGGDGTLNYFINHYPDINLPLTIFNGGTGNDVHWYLSGTKTLEEQIETALTAAAKPVDAGKCNDRFFINGAGIGFEGEVAKSLTGKKKLPGKTSFLITILKKIFTFRSKWYVIKSGGADLSGRKLMIDISNGSRAGGGFHVAPESKIDDGLFDVIVIEPMNPLQRLRRLPVIERGKHLHLPFVKHFRAGEITIESDVSIQSHLDGEYYTAKRMEIKILPGKFLFRY
jgi:YegS/Rv2252/BmrU family lipid kinase